MNEGSKKLSHSMLCQQLGYTTKDLVYMAHLLVPFGGLRDIKLEPGETVVICPATGGFSGAGVQIAAAMGCKVIAMGRDEKELARLKEFEENRLPSAAVEAVKITHDEKKDTAHCCRYIAERAGWRWPYWVSLYAAGVVTVGNILLNTETNSIILMRRKAVRLRKELNRPELQFVFNSKDEIDMSMTTVLSRGIVRPVRMLFGTPILLLLATYMSFVFGLLYLLFTTLTSLYISTYH
ncbi:hypothetical protein TSTA_098380 [Talaromyces stipitatus ATCC 10500]|uniref:Alcohol dehydrogenase-like C-terminal domain-containing protein n=1 Tax=Talaromyces stipitatus (strain ATCC 10500 / CBS 375.48 / QM 6759 / NRRL 1006) TaxID=441959 RepID=B8MM69_TALSN|nr:uncharacterized protein TSTA_098380 [Talaromyces stipitatus ATCC 10500]EED13581.1 hypothetical protein TSTA_098380 [Talaromyces stipitatus ATCC 10500]